MAELTIQQAFDLAWQHHQVGRLQEAEQLYRQILTHQPKHAAANHHLGLIAYLAGRNDAAVDLIRRAIAINPGYAEAHGNLGNALLDSGQPDEAIAAYRRAIALNPSLAEAHSNLGHAMKEKGELDEAIAACRRAISIRPNFAKGHGNLGNSLKEKGRFDEAIAAYRHAISLDPNSPETHYNLSFALLAKGDFQRGWEEYEWRWKCRGFPTPRRNFTQPQWDGSSFEGRTLLLYAEQGFGDAIQFIRYLPLVAERGGKIIIGCQPELQRLFQTIVGKYEIVTSGALLPEFDLHFPLLSLPRVFGTMLDNIPKSVPYLHADSEEAEKWNRRLAGDSSRMNVGLTWAGSQIHKNDRNRSMKLAMLAPLGQIPGVPLYQFAER